MIRNRYFVTSVLSVSILVGALAWSGASYASASRAARSSKTVLKVATVSISNGGKTVKKSALVNSSGRAVYLLTGDSESHPKCKSTTCTGNWPPVTSSAAHPAVGSSVKGTVAVWKHNGIDQVTLNGHPLYTYVGDSSADSATGEGLSSFGGTWKVVSPSGSAVAMASSSSGGGGW